MKLNGLLLCILISQQIMAQSYQKIHKKAIVVDSHNDILMHTMESGFEFDKNLKGHTHLEEKQKLSLENLSKSLSYFQKFGEEKNTKELFSIYRSIHYELSDAPVYALVELQFNSQIRQKNNRASCSSIR